MSARLVPHNQNGFRQTSQNNLSSKRFISSWRRLKQDYMMIMKDPIPYVSVAPLPSDLLEWHYVIRGPENTVYHGGIYHGKLRFPIEYPFKPPSIYMFTPNGRFKTNTRLCLSFSDFHPDTWNPTWSLSTLLTGLLSFMLEEHSAVGSIHTPDGTRRLYAKKSLRFNLKNETFVELFPEIADEIKNHLAKEEEEENSLKNNIKAIKNRLNNLSAGDGQQNASESNLFQRFLWSGIYNLIVFLIFVLFVYIVHLVLTNKSIVN